MRRPHVFQRSTPRTSREAQKDIDHRPSTARLLAAQLGNMIDKADGAGLSALADLLEIARVEAERFVPDVP